MDISEVNANAPTVWGGGAAALIIAALTIRRWMSRDKVDRSLDAATVQLVQSLMADRDAANKRAADADARADAALSASAALQSEIALLRYKVEALNAQVAQLTGKPLEHSA